MTAFVLDYASYAELSAEDKKLVAKMPKFKELVLSFEKMGQQDDIDFSNQESFEIAGIGSLSLYGLALLAYSSLDKEETKSGVNKKTGVAYTVVGTPKLYALKSPAWDALRRIQAGKVAQGLEFPLDGTSLRALLEASL